MVEIGFVKTRNTAPDIDLVIQQILWIYKAFQEWINSELLSNS